MKPIRRAYVIVGLTIIGWLVVIGLALLAAEAYRAVASWWSVGPR